MNSEDIFRESLEKLLSQREFPLAEDSWEQASQVIDASRKNKKRRVFILFFSGLFLLFTGSLFFYLANKTETVSDNKIVSAKKDILQTTQQSGVDESNNAGGQTIKENSGSSHKTGEADHVSEEKTNGGVNSSSAEIKKAEPNASTFANGLNAALSLKQTRKKALKNAIVNGNVLVMGNVAIKKTVIIKDPKNVPLKTKLIVKAAEQATETVLQSAGVPVSAEKDSLLSAATATSAPLNETLKDSSVAIAMKRDTAALAAQEVIKTPKANSYTISAEGGLIYLAGWNYPGKKDAKGYNPVIGLNYSRSIFKNIIAAAGISYYSVGQLSYSSKTAKITGYGFGEKSDVTVITPTRLHYMGFPLKLSYVINRNNSAGLGCNIAYLMNVAAQTETYRQNVNQISEYRKSKEYGYIQGFKNFDVQAAMFYNRRIYKELSVSAEFVYGLTDIKNNAFFNSNVFEGNVGVKVTLIYNIFKK